MEYDVTIDRDKYIGGSDIPVIMGISRFKTRWQLLQEKAGLIQNCFTGNAYTEYGKVMEPKIRDYINKGRKKKFTPEQVIKGDLRGNSDGFDGDTILEVKTTSQEYETVDEYMEFLVQLLFYMDLYEVKKGKLDVYIRPEDFNTDFNEDRLKEYEVNISEYKNLLESINAEIMRFRRDLERLKNNPLLSEQDFQPNDIVELSQKVLELERHIAELKTFEAEQKKVKQALFEAMAANNIKSWETPNGIKITRVDATEATVKTVTEFDVDTFKAENPALFDLYQHDVEKRTSGKSGYVKITLPKGA